LIRTLKKFLRNGPGAWPVWLQLLILGALFIAVGLPVDAVIGLAAGSLTEQMLLRPSIRR
jgi:threonine/homoserine/homoserine lactone efflux protein